MKYPKKLTPVQLDNFIRKIRCDIIKMTCLAGSGHPGGSLSAADIASFLITSEMIHDPDNPNLPERDRLVFSKGHASPLLYSLLAETGYFERSELWKFRKLDSLLQGHPSIEIPGVEISTGSLGHGISAAVGMALGLRTQKLNSSRVFCLTGDGEHQEGMVWEAIMSAAHYNLNQLCVLLDYNKLQIDGKIEVVMNIADIQKKYEAFNWNTIEIDGHNLDEIRNSLELFNKCNDKPTVIICHTIKGKGVSFMENNPDWHGKTTNQNQTIQAFADLNCPEAIDEY